MSRSTSTPTTSTPTTPTSTRVEGVFTDGASLARAVERLSEKSVPADSIRVFIRDDEGNRGEELEVENQFGALRGALIAAGLGALAGLAVSLTVSAGLYGPVEVGFVSLRGFGGALRAMLALAVAAVPIGALLGMGYWQGRKRVDADELDSGSAVVIVESDELHELAHRVLTESGASSVEVEHA